MINFYVNKNQQVIINNTFRYWRFSALFRERSTQYRYFSNHPGGRYLASSAAAVTNAGDQWHPDAFAETQWRQRRVIHQFCGIDFSLQLTPF